MPPVYRDYDGDYDGHFSLSLGQDLESPTQEIVLWLCMWAMSLTMSNENTSDYGQGHSLCRNWTV